MTPSQETCRALTGYIGEKWHGVHWLNKCFCGEVNCEQTNRTFTLPDDLFVVYGKMVEREEWHDFLDFMLVKSGLKFRCAIEPSGTIYLSYDHTAWFFCLNASDQIGERMEMAGRWVEEKSHEHR